MKNVIEICRQMLRHLSEPVYQRGKEEDRIRRQLNIVVSSFLRLKQEIRYHHFRDISEQILFYKDIEPLFFERLVYYNKLIDIESNTPMGKQDLISYYRNRLAEITSYIERHKFLLHYHDNDNRYLDSILFIHPTMEMGVYAETEECRDAAFFNYTSFVISKGKAYGHLATYLAGKINLILSDAKSSASSPMQIARLYESESVAKENKAIRTKLSWLETGIVSESADAELYLKKLADKKTRVSQLLSKLST